MLDTRLLAIPAGLLLLGLAQLAAGLRKKPLRKKKPALPGPGFTLIYADRCDEAGKGPAVSAHLLTDARYALQGKPDMIYANGRRYIPVELKSGAIGDSPLPREGDLMQLAVYFRLVEAEYGVRPANGRLIYRDAMFIVANTRALRRRLTQTLADMRGMLSDPEALPPPNPHFPKCRRCPCRDTVCGSHPEA